MTDPTPDDARVNVDKLPGPAPIPPGALGAGPVPPAGFGPPPEAYPPPVGAPYPSPGGPAVLVAIGDIICTENEVITPSGTIPIAGSQWWITDMSLTKQEISTTGIILAVVLLWFICLFSLLFLLMKETKTNGYLQVTVSGGGLTHVTTIPALTPTTAPDVHGRVDYARNLAARF